MLELPEHVLYTLLIIVESQRHDGPHSPTQSGRAILTLCAGRGTRSLAPACYILLDSLFGNSCVNYIDCLINDLYHLFSIIMVNTMLSV
jgi:hypothetical protein